MSKILYLTKVLWKNGSNKEISDKKNKKIFAYLFLAIYLFGVFGFLSYEMISSFKLIGQESAFISLLLFAVVGMIFFTSIFACTNIFYLSKDINYLLPLPFKPREIFFAKFNMLLFYEYIVEAMFALPSLVVYGVTTGMGVLFYIYSIIVLLLLPIVPLIISSLIVMIIMCFSNITKYKDKFQTVVSFIAIGVAIAMQFLIRAFSNGEGDLDASLLLAKADGLMNVVNKYFVTLGPASKSLVYSNEFMGIISLIVFIIISFVVIALFSFIGDKLYFKGLLGNMENAKEKPKKHITKAVANKESLLKTFVENQFRLLVRNPIFFIQCVAPNFLIPILFAAIFTINGDTGEMSGMLASLGINKSLVFFISLAIIQFITSINFTTITAISRNARCAATYEKTLPVSLYKQAIYKMIPGIILDIAAICITTTILAFALKMSLDLYLVIVITAFIITIPRNYVLLFVDLKKPKLDWDTEYVVVKQNMNMIYEMIICFIFISLFIAGAIMLSTFNYLILATVICSIFIAVWKIEDNYFRKNMDELYYKIS